MSFKYLRKLWRILYLRCFRKSVLIEWNMSRLPHFFAQNVFIRQGFAGLNPSHLWNKLEYLSFALQLSSLDQSQVWWSRLLSAVKLLFFARSGKSGWYWFVSSWVESLMDKSDLVRKHGCQSQWICIDDVMEFDLQTKFGESVSEACRRPCPIPISYRKCQRVRLMNLKWVGAPSRRAEHSLCRTFPKSWFLKFRSPNDMIGSSKSFVCTDLMTFVHFWIPSGLLPSGIYAPNKIVSWPDRNTCCVWLLLNF